MPKAKEGHPFRNFGWGNLRSLKDFNFRFRLKVSVPDTFAGTVTGLEFTWDLGFKGLGFVVSGLGFRV